MQGRAIDKEMDRGGWTASPLYWGEVQFRRLLDKLPAGAYTCDAEGLITYFNRHAVELWGREPKLNDPKDRFCGSFKLLASDGSLISHDRCWMALALKNNREYDGQEIIIERPNGRRVHALAHASPVHDENGRLLGAVNVLVDITERKRAEEALREIREAERSRIAHELHNGVLQDLAAALQGMQAVQVESGQIRPDRLKEEMAALRRAVGGLRDAIYDLRLDKQQPLVRAAESLVEFNRQLAPERRIRLTVRGTPPKFLNGAGVELLRVLQEALANVRHHSGAHEVEVILSATRHSVRAEVIDDGRGFDPASVREGLGIPGMRERILELGGTLRIESTPGRGTSVSVEVPSSLSAL